MTFPRSEADLPTAGDPRRLPGVGDIVTYDEGLARRLPPLRGEPNLGPAYAFGHGLSYTRFRFSGLRVNRGRGRRNSRRGRKATSR